MGGRKIIPLLSILFLLLLGCTNSSRQENEPNTMIEMPSIDERPTYPPTQNYQFPVLNLETVSCRDPIFEEDFDHWGDKLIPGISTVDDFVTLANIPEDVDPETIESWWGNGAGDVWAKFDDGILFTKSDPRKKLSEIYRHYGPPNKVVWRLPSFNNHQRLYETILVYPDLMALFFASEKVTRFSPNTDFDFSIFTTNEFFSEISSFESDRFDQYIESSWPCDKW